MVIKKRIAYLGPVASYSHQATLKAFPAEQYDHVPQVTIRDIFEIVQSGTVYRGVVPFENSTNGSVIFTLDLLADRSKSYVDVMVCQETYLDVHHCLVGQEPKHRNPHSSTHPGPNLKHINKIYSHPQAFGQCENFLGAYLKGIERVDVSSTSRAAGLVKDEDGSSAAIASQIAAEVHGLKVLASSIEDREDNTTRFFVLQKQADSNQTADFQCATPASGANRSKSLVSFTVDHKSPGALADVLNAFKEFGLDLTSINSRPSRLIPFQYIFFVEFEGSRYLDPDGKVNGALTILDKTAHSWRFLGSFEDSYKK